MRTVFIMLAGLLSTTAGLAPAAAARTFYIDAALGDDAHEGLTPEAAWRSLARVNRAALAPGDRVLFRRGCSWRGQLAPRSGSADGAITYGAFGEGPKPVLLGSVAADRPEDWQPAGEHLWETVPVRFEATGAEVELLSERWSLHQESGAACELTREKQGAPGKTVLRLTCRNSGTRANHLQLSFPGLTVREGKYYLLTFRAKVTKPLTPASVTLMKSGPPWSSYAEVQTSPPAIGPDWSEHTVRFLAGQDAADARVTFFLGGALSADATLLLEPVRIVQVKCNQAVPLSVDVGNIIFDGGKAVGVKKWQPAELRRDGDYFYDADSWQVRLRSEANPATRHQGIELALRRHIIDQGGRRSVTYEDLDLRYGAAHGIGGDNTRQITVRRCDISYIGGGHQLTHPDGTPVRYGNGIEFWSSARDCLVEDCRIWEIYDAALTNQGSGTNVQEGITYRRNVIWNSEYSFEYWNGGPASRTHNIVFEHNTCVDAGFGWGHGQRPDPNGRHLMFYNNTAATTQVVIRDNIFCKASDSLLRLTGTDWAAALTMERNCWFQSRGPWAHWAKETLDAEGFPAFMHQRGWALHGVPADPQFVDPAKRDYRLGPSSPARASRGHGRPAGALP